MSEKRRKDLTTDQRMAKAEVAIENTLNLQEIQELFTPVGYSPERMLIGKDKFTNVVKLIAKQKDEYGEKYAATEAVHEARVIANKVYMRTLKMARILLSGKHGNESLGLTGARKESIPAWFMQADTFYVNLIGNQKFLDAMAPTGKTVESFKADHLLIQAVKTALQKQENETGEAEESTLLRDEALDDFFAWMHDFYEFADIALEDHPQWKERLGILERS